MQEPVEGTTECSLEPLSVPRKWEWEHRPLPILHKDNWDKDVVGSLPLPVISPGFQFSPKKLKMQTPECSIGVKYDPDIFAKLVESLPKVDDESFLSVCYPDGSKIEGTGTIKPGRAVKKPANR